VLNSVILKDSATLSGGIRPTGTITFELFGPDGVTIVDKETVAVNGNGTYVTPTGFVPTAPGVYNWVAIYSGDLNNPMRISRFGDEPATVVEISKRLFFSDPPDPVVPASLNGLVAPALITPGGPTSDSQPPFAWSAVSGADHYDLSINDNTTGQIQVVRAQNVPSTLFSPAAPFSLGHSYTWWVRAISATGVAGPWSAGSDFSITLAAPTLGGPTGSLQNATPTFTWSAVPGATSYDVAVYNLAGSQTLTRVSGTSFTPTTPLAIGGYEWWVRAVVPNLSTGPWTDAGTFNVAPLAPVSPVGPGGAIQTALPTLLWNAGVGADSYDVCLYDATTPTQVINRVTATAWTPANSLVPGHQYEWWVRGVSNNGDMSGWSSGLTFTVAFLPAPLVLAPTGSVTNVLPTFTWSAAAGADYYEFVVADLATGQNVLRMTHVAGLSFSANTALQPGHAYEWWVRTFSNNGDYSLWSAGLAFNL
jgi:hypothetical protein